MNDDDTPSFLRKTIATAVKGNEVGAYHCFFMFFPFDSSFAILACRIENAADSVATGTPKVEGAGTKCKKPAGSGTGSGA